MRIDIAPLLRGEIKTIGFDYEIELPQDFFEGDANAADITDVSSLSVKGTLENLAGYMKLSAKATLRYTAQCARCLKPVESTLELDFEKTAAVKGTLENEDNDDYVLAEDGMIDIDEPLLEEMLLELPFRHLCSQDCKGLCPKCGKNLNEGQCGCDTKTIDPRLEVLRQLLDKQE
nr:DUF177 domain-containing protein [Clostridia bacterium]